MQKPKFGGRNVPRANNKSVLSLSKRWLSEHGIEDRGLISRRMNESGDLVLTAVTDGGNETFPEVLEQQDERAGGSVTPEASNVETKEGS